MFDFSVLFTAFFAGLLGSGHCFGMCGGIATGLGGLSVDDKKQAARYSAILFNTGRIISYASLGLIAAVLLVQAGTLIDVPMWGVVLRLLTSLMILLIGLQFLFSLNFLAGIERAGAKVWKLVLPLAVRASSLPGGSGRLLLGLCWGLLPCGLVYSVLLTATASGSALSGALIMATFGLGTLPSMLGMSFAAPALASLLNDQWTRKLLGGAMILLALLSVSLLIVQPDTHLH